MARVKYNRIRVNGKSVQLHNYIWEQANGKIPEGYVIDHIDGDTFNNDLSNLRLATPSQNQWNKRVLKNNKLGIKGLRWVNNRGCFRASVARKGVRPSFCGSLLDCVAFLITTRKELHGEFARN